MSLAHVLRFGLVSEGPSDYRVLCEIVREVIPGAEVVPLHPELPLGAYPEYAEAQGGARRGAGWRGVKAWCEDYQGEDLALLLHGVVGQEYDALIVHLDASMADKLGIDAACPPANATTVPLQRAVWQEWLAMEAPPPYLLLATPSKMTDAWVVAALWPEHPDLECDLRVEDVLVQKQVLRRRGGEIKKPRDLYESLAQAVASNLAEVRRICSEADRFVRELEQFAQG